MPSPEDLVVRDRRPQQQPLRHGAVGVPLGIAGAAAHAGKNGVIDAVVLAPAADRVIPGIALDEPILRPHDERFEGERLAGRQLRHHEVLVVQEQAVRPQDELVRARLGIDRRAQIDPEILDRGLRLRVDDAAVERLLGNLEVRLEQQRREGSVS